MMYDEPSKNTSIVTCDQISSEVDYFTKLNSKMDLISGEAKDGWRAETIPERYLRLNKLIYQKFGGIIQSGPFEGMRIPKTSSWLYPHTAQMLLGIYETSVHDVLFDDRFSSRKTFIDIGAADGYYPIGLCLSGRMDEAIAFEISADSRGAIEQNAISNHQQAKISIYEEANLDTLADLRKKFGMDDAIVLVDIEGSEFKLLSKEVLFQLQGSVIIIEVHNWIENFSSQYQAFLEDANCYFQVEKLIQRSIDLRKMDLISEFPDDNRYLIMSEGRPCLMRFLLLTPRIK